MTKPRNNSKPSSRQAQLKAWTEKPKLFDEPGTRTFPAAGATAFDIYVKEYKETYMSTYSKTLERYAAMSRFSLPEYVEMTGLKFEHMEAIDSFTEWSVAYASLTGCLDLSLKEFSDRNTKAAMDSFSLILKPGKNSVKVQPSIK